MSWKGFVKAVQRLPHQVMTKTGHADETVDEEFNLLNAEFEHLEQSTTRLQEDASKFKKSVEALFLHQHTFASTLLEVYSPISGKAATGNSPPPSLDGSSSNYSEVAETRSTMTRTATPPESLEAVRTYMNNVEAAQALIMQDLSSIDRRIIQPAVDLLTIFKNIHKTILKRNHKLIDYDRYRVDVAKLRAAPTKDVKDERRMLQLEQALQQATYDFAALNDALKAQLPQFLSLRKGFIDPCFQSLYYLQVKVYQAMLGIMEPMRQFQQFDFGAPVVASFEAKKAHTEHLINELSILKFKPAALVMAASGVGSAPGSAVAPTISPSVSARITPSASSPSAFAARPVSPGGASSSMPPPQYSPPSSSAVAPVLGKSPAAAASAAPVLGAGTMTMPTPAKGVAPTLPPAPAAAPAAPAVRIVTALYDFDAQQPDDLGFKVGDRIEILEATPSTNDWWKGKCNGKVGYFPANYTH
ncbi:hypothetical protein AMAG_02314 [Allomyces macrogynus ATCC 38327]|uniref:BAR domain-containing protein n=1 Tax=Allomyces macrogynus (strain ATCC 38327) TaxID=578462 RepID=A0A0L0S1R9_ALLM3|nr:hypothetical protein AMAG_02314 [Allomyces macrogynus ATCC 38327]|eukprot:KNE56512.1 hypothetical protein AMAG_02314 [Allomyces macrogynus ATCC 38327]